MCGWGFGGLFARRSENGLGLCAFAGLPCIGCLLVRFTLIAIVRMLYVVERIVGGHEAVGCYVILTYATDRTAGGLEAVGRKTHLDTT